MVVLSAFFLASCQTTKLFEPWKKAFDGSACSIQILVIVVLKTPRYFGRNSGVRVTLLNRLQHGLGIIGFIRQHGPDLAQLDQQRWPLRHISCLSPREQKSYWIAQRIHQRMDFCGEATS